MVQIPLDLKEGELCRRVNRFVFEGRVNNRHILLHCPATGRINNCKDFSGLPFLYLPSDGKHAERKTSGTVEAISFDGRKSWVGIDQTRINHWIDSLLRQNLLARMVDTKNCLIKRECKVGKRRLDFAIQPPDQPTIFFEIKTPLKDLFTAENESDASEIHPYPGPISHDFFERLRNHCETLKSLIEKNFRAILGMCFMYPAVRFAPANPPPRVANDFIASMLRAVTSGLETWQINLRISPEGLTLRDYFPIEIFPPDAKK